MSRIHGCNQETFDTVVKGLASQGFERCVNKEGRCVFVHGDRRCALGWLITAAEYSPTMESQPFINIVRGLTGLKPGIPECMWLDALSMAHDIATSPEDMISMLRKVGEKYGFSWPLEESL